MYGHFNICLEKFIIAEHGEDVWNKIKSKVGIAKIDAEKIYDEFQTIQLFQEAAELLGFKKEAIMEMVGEYYITYLVDNMTYKDRVKSLAGNLFDFFNNIDSLLAYMKTNVFSDLDAPSFRIETLPDGNMELHYYTSRFGMYHVVMGMAKAVARNFFGQPNLDITLKESQSEVEAGRTLQHTTFVIPSSKKKRKAKAAPPVYVAQTKKGQEKQIDKKQLDAIMANIKTGNVKKSRKRWAMIKTAMAMGALVNRFEPIFPDRTWVTPEVFCLAFPFHIVFDNELTVKHAGLEIQRLFPPIRLPDAKVNQYFDLTFPPIDFATISIRKFKNQLYILQTKERMLPPAWKNGPLLELRGQMIWMQSLNSMVFLASPKFKTLPDVIQRHMYFADIALHDVTRDFVWSNSEKQETPPPPPPQIIRVEKKKTEMKVVPVQKPQMDDRNKAELEALRISQHMTMCAMLPSCIANKWVDSRNQIGDFETGVYEETTVLFADIVMFSLIVQQCRPVEVVQMLNNLYRAFDKLTIVHDVFKVEYIGDAYCAIGGLPTVTASHADRICNMSLAMLILSQQIVSPITREPVVMRIGVHTGPVITGVIGQKIPRYCVFGSTLTIASRMESHGIPGRIQISPATQMLVSNRGFVTEERGEIDVKGIGLMFVYLLEGNDTVTLEDLIGTGPHKANYTPVNGGGGNFLYEDDDGVQPMVYPENQINDIDIRRDKTGSRSNLYKHPKSKGLPRVESS